MRFLLALLPLLALIECQSQVDWCQVQTEKCGSSTHIGCVKDYFGKPVPADLKVVELTQAQKDVILHEHNIYRQQIASGAHKAQYGFPAAARMPVMHWDNNLEYLAKRHASLGQFQHDRCRATRDYPYSGQNLYITMSYGTPNPEVAIRSACKAWFDEIKVADPALVTKLTSSNLGQAGHFSVMVNDKNTAVGCGASSFKYNGWNALMVTCNYAYTNMLNTPNYVVGTPCQSCGCSTKYNALSV